MKKLSIVMLALAVFAFVLAACATPPTEEMDRAHDAVTRAENDSDAVTYAAGTLVRAREALTKMQSEADAKRYDAAKNFAAEAISNAEKAIDDGKTGAARARDEAANLVNGLSAPIEETAVALNAARQAGNLDIDLDSLSNDMDLARFTYEEAQKALADNNYSDATAKAQVVRPILSNINTQLREAVQITSRKQ